jgi:hypothetical protein
MQACNALCRMPVSTRRSVVCCGCITLSHIHFIGQSLEEMISVLNRRLDVGEGRERVLKSRVDLLQGRLTQVLVTRHTSLITLHTAYSTCQIKHHTSIITFCFSGIWWRDTNALGGD